MLFNSFDFLLFFPIVTLLYFVIPHRFRYLWLLVASYFFYMCWNPKYIVLIGFSTVVTYLSGLFINKANTMEKKKLWVALSLAINLSVLFFFKYVNFVAENLVVMFGNIGLDFSIPQFDVMLPVGISFYTFQALSYTIDVYRGDVKVEKNFFKYALFVSFFPQLVAGPIERSKNLIVQISERHYFDYERARYGISLMLYGLFLKLVIADRAAILVNQVYNQYQQYIGLHIVIATLCFALQIYCDFGSYSIIAKGAAKVMGFTLMENFKQPYFSCSIREFWQRWHISLSTWFRDYLYIPLGGNRKGKLRSHINTMIVFLASGLWHGANWTFIIWGGLHGLYLVIGNITRPWKIAAAEALGIDRNRFSYRLMQGMITFVLVCFAWIFFRAPSYEVAMEIIDQMLKIWNPICLVNGEIWALGLSMKSFVVGLIAVFVMTLISIAEYRGIDVWERLGNQGFLLRFSVYLMLIFSILIFGIYGPGFEESQFIYFQF